MEKKAFSHHHAQEKFLSFKDKSLRAGKIYDELSSDDPRVLDLLKDGDLAFRRRVAERIYKEHFDELERNLCPKCGGIARTPFAKQCRYCGSD
ncbi:hypothetical protein [Aureibacter tunicatorum]|uniref:Ribosomal protein L40E n=1 Tax=Aureibacter tunicatorum TaxID=866807 RepID=A0AAE3XMN1_9BACT|nr:hypothetical protein [Aureibacter tunicatorum]MDR6238778.1 ribosomal protein L40E [Aureibacter tunicatorum]